ncbi:MAG: thiamine pyrophosphate-dependent dehydrogenase E1 component subunit alpha [Sulfobacillus sp.]
MGEIHSIDGNTLTEIYRNFYLARRFEEILSDMFRRGEIDGWLHSGIGQELVGSILGVALTPQDYIVPYHRSKATFLSRGVPPHALIAEILGRQSGLCGGVGGEAHAADVSRGIFGSTGVIGAGFPLALGAAFKQFYRASEGIAVCGFGDGATTRGSFHECMNLAALWNLPLVFICENNLYSEMTPLRKEMKETRIAKKADAYGMPGVAVDGYDLDTTYRALQEAFVRARSGQGPSLVEVKTYRWHGHYEGDPEEYRDKGEVDSWQKRDPLPVLRQRIQDEGILDAFNLDQTEKDIEELLSQAVASAKASPFPTRENLLINVYAQEGSM